MKKIYKYSFILILFLLGFNTMQGAIEYGLDNSCSTTQLVVYVTPDQVYAGGEAVWAPGVFTISYPMTMGTGILGAVSNQNGFSYATAGLLGNDGTNYYQKYAFTGNTTLSMTSGNSYEVVRIALIGGVGVFGTFEIPASDNAWVVDNGGPSVFSNSIGNQVVSPYSAVSVVNIPLFAGIFWDGTSWCGGTQANQEPGAADGALNCYVNGPGALITYFNGVVNQLNISSGADLTIGPGFALTANGATHIEDAQSIMITADPSGTGSFIDNGTITYGTGPGSAEVQAYIAHAGDYTFQMHQIGPMVNDPSFSLPGAPTQKGVYLQEFDLLQNNTYAYQYLEPTNTWQNLWQLTDPVPTPHGIMLSDNSGVSKTLSQIGMLNTGTITTVPFNAGSPWSPSYNTTTGNGCLLLSNPYPSGFDIDVLYSTNNIAFNSSPSFYIWQHGLGGGEVANGNYATWNAQTVTGTGAMNGSGGMISPGQGFFGVLSFAWPLLGNPPVTFNNTMRSHYHAPFVKNQHTNLFRMIANGNSSTDELIIYFFEGGAYEIDTLDTYKWESMYEGVTQVYSLATTGEKLTQNILPPLENEAVSVPVEFICGTSAEYSLTASDLETFLDGTEIYLEDILTGEPWHNLMVNPVYEFTATPEDPAGRFIVHFFGPTGIDDPNADIDAVQIYAWGQDAYIVNRGKETIKEYVAYDMMGRELHRGTLPNSTVNKVTIGDVSAYYIVKVITKEGRIYTDKVYITK